MIIAIQRSLLDNLMAFVAQDGLYAAVLIFAVLWFRRHGLRAGLAAGLGALLAVGIAVLIGDLRYSPRPFVAGHYAPLFAHGDDASFPSDHLCALGAISAGAWMSSRLLGTAGAILALLVAVARVYAGVHYPSDVLAGFLLGAACALLVWYALQPVMPLVNRIDAGLQRRGFRPSETKHHR